MRVSEEEEGENRMAGRTRGSAENRNGWWEIIMWRPWLQIIMF